MNRAALLAALLTVGCSGASAPGQPEATCSDPGFHLAVGTGLLLRFSAPAHVYAVHGRAELGVPGIAVCVLALESDGELAVVGASGAEPAVEIRACDGTDTVWPIATEPLP